VSDAENAIREYRAKMRKTEEEYTEMQELLA